MRGGDTMQIRHLSAFVAVADTGSFRAASRRLGISQPSLTKTIREIERILGVALVQRTVRGSQPTDMGRVFLVRARSIIQEMRRAREEIEQAAGGQAGCVTVGLSIGASLLLGPSAIKAFMAAHPAVQVRITEDLFEQLVSGVRQNLLDFSVGGLPAAEAGADIEIEPLFENKIVPAVRHGHGLAAAVSFAELTDSDWAITNDEPAYVARLSNHFASLGLPAPRVLLRAEPLLMLLDLVAASDLIVAMPHTLLRHPLVAERLVEIAVREPCPMIRFGMVRKAGVPLTPLAAELASHMRRSAIQVHRRG